MISIRTDTEDPGPSQVQTRTTGGSYRYFKSQLDAHWNNGDWNARMFGAKTLQGGFRNQNFTENNLFHTRLRYGNWANGKWSLTFRAFDSPQSEDPGGLTFNQARNNPRQARQANRTFDSGEEVAQETVRVGYQKQLGETNVLYLTGHFIHRDF